MAQTGVVLNVYRTHRSTYGEPMEIITGRENGMLKYQKQIKQ